MLDDSPVPRAFHLSNIGRDQGTNLTLLLPSDIREERYPEYKVDFFGTKY